MREENKKKMTKAEAGRRGGKRTLEKHGPEHFKKLGEKGQATIKKVWEQYKKSKETTD
jgi:general stress protein YciG